VTGACRQEVDQWCCLSHKKRHRGHLVSGDSQKLAKPIGERSHYHSRDTVLTTPRREHTAIPRPAYECDDDHTSPVTFYSPHRRPPNLSYSISLPPRGIPGAPPVLQQPQTASAHSTLTYRRLGSSAPGIAPAHLDLKLYGSVACAGPDAEPHATATIGAPLPPCRPDSGRIPPTYTASRITLARASRQLAVRRVLSRAR
jgi:hypothetical protein